MRKFLVIGLSIAIVVSAIQLFFSISEQEVEEIAGLIFDLIFFTLLFSGTLFYIWLFPKGNLEKLESSYAEIFKSLGESKTSIWIMASLILILWFLFIGEDIYDLFLILSSKSGFKEWIYWAGIIGISIKVLFSGFLMIWLLKMLFKKEPYSVNQYFNKKD